jgi:predicted Rossmann fold nucleotide-binding protein DprA/Smf involved in DNA uptake
MNELIARAALFSAIEGGHTFWSREINSNSALFVYDKLLNNGYDRIKFEKLIAELKLHSGEQVLERIAQHHVRLVTPCDEDWPIQVNDLIAPPIALIVKGNISALHLSSLAIVGTRNPTSYGARIAGDFAAGFADREWGIISGGAYGIDSYAHKGALIAEGEH